jgi:hypothetical protein
MAQDHKVLLSLLSEDTKYVFLPTIKGWNRLEGRPRKQEFNRSLKAEIHDPLWLLTRQWQFGEFTGEDAGSPIDSQITVNQKSLNQYIVNGEARTYDEKIPLEVRVERDFLKKDVLLQVQLAKYFLKLLADEPNIVLIKKSLIEKYQLDENGRAYQDKNSLQYLKAIRGKLFDGFQLMEDFNKNDVSKLADINLISTTNPINNYLKKLSDYFKRLYSQPIDESENAWQASKLEYQFACSSTESSENEVFLDASQYTQGHLDWFNFNIENSLDFEIKPGENILPPKVKNETLSCIPAPVAFNGMPSPRFWEMENYKTEFADLDVNTTDTAKILLTEFALIYSNDWCLIPYETEVGTIIDIRTMIVTDCFGEKTVIKASGEGVDNDWQRWNIFGLNTEKFYADNRFFLAPSLSKSLHGDSIEKVNFLRDEISNLVWAVSNVVPNAIGSGINGYEAAQEMNNNILTSPIPTSTIDLLYKLGKEVPLNWTPFLPSRVEGSSRSIQLQRAQMPNQTKTIRGNILDEKAPFFIHEEEVPRSGKIISQSFQRARGVNGEVFLWLSKKIENGKGEGSSGLTFDQLVNKTH